MSRSALRPVASSTALRYVTFRTRTPTASRRQPRPSQSRRFSLPFASALAQPDATSSPPPPRGSALPAGTTAGPTALRRRLHAPVASVALVSSQFASPNPRPHVLLRLCLRPLPRLRPNLLPRLHPQIPQTHPQLHLRRPLRHPQRRCRHLPPARTCRLLKKSFRRTPRCFSASLGTCAPSSRGSSRLWRRKLRMSHAKMRIRKRPSGHGQSCFSFGW